MKESTGSDLPLQGVRIIDWTTAQTGPSATQLLADMGAEVIKVESPQGGDVTRNTKGDSGTAMMLTPGLSYNFENLNRNKKSLTVDLAKPAGKRIIYDLAVQADVFVQNFRLGAAKKLGLDYATLQQHNPSLIYANCTGFGPRGKQAAQIAKDPAIHAASGMMLGIGEANMPPVHLPGAMSDQTTGIMLAYNIMVALFYRERTGIGQEINVSMLGTMLWVQTNNILYTLLKKRPRERQLRTKPANPLVNHYCCQDGRWILFGNFQPDRCWPGFCRALGREDLRDDPRFCNLTVRGENSAALVAILDQVFPTKTREAWLALLEAEKDIIYSPIKDYWEVVNDPQVWENNYLVQVDHPAVGKVPELGTPGEFSKTPGSIRHPAPELGQHTQEVLGDLLGYSGEKIEGLRNDGVIL